MKATIQKPAFSPITLTLETEAEANAIYAVLYHPKLSEILGIGDLPSPLAMGFSEDMENFDTRKIHEDITSNLKARK